MFKHSDKSSPNIHQRRHSNGFASSFDDYKNRHLVDFNLLLMPNPASSFAFIIQGANAQHWGIHDKDLLIIDRTLQPNHNDLVLGQVDGKLKLHKLIKQNNSFYLENCQQHKIMIDENITVYGVLAKHIHNWR